VRGNLSARLEFLGMAAEGFRATRFLAKTYSRCRKYSPLRPTIHRRDYTNAYTALTPSSSSHRSFSNGRRIVAEQFERIKRILLVLCQP
jgi:hypothetical protein